MAFKSKASLNLSAESPESLFADIKSKKIPGLLTQQGDILREYTNNFVASSDLAIQSPTGSGKTLVALLILEWRRITHQKRVVYLCPTKQLVHQVANQSSAIYGINVNTFIGSKYDYDPLSEFQYNSSQAIAVTTYSSLFNVNPFFEDPDVIVFDDAHAAEQYVSSNWTINLKEYVDSDKAAFNAICSLIKPHLQEADYLRVSLQAASSQDVKWVEKIPDETAVGLFPKLEEVLDANIGNSEERYPWQVMKGKLKACNIYLTSQEITIRPFLAPTFSHRPFENATQRIYLSATPGEGGELERVFCRRKIDRLTPSVQSKRHAIGRRYFVFPELNLDEIEQSKLLIELSNKHRLLVLAGDNRTADKYKMIFRNRTSTKIFEAKDIESSKDRFISSVPSVAVLANRYDGIDFPNEECRVIFLVNIPTAINPQEMFFKNRLAANQMYEARNLTRVIQSFGRCTRSATDYSVVLVLGDRITRFLSKKDRQSFFNPEMQGELQFGFEESSSTTLNNTIENIDHFLAQDEEWKRAEAQIFAVRNQSHQQALVGSDELAKSVTDEVKFMTHLWYGNTLGAFDACKSVLAQLNDPSLCGVRALWNYFSGSMCARLSKNNRDSFRLQSRQYYMNAGKAAPSLTWLHELGATFDVKSEENDISISETKQIDSIENYLNHFGIAHDRKFNIIESDIRKAILSADNFEQGHKLLGEHVGFEAGKIESDGSPDPWWKCSSDLVLVFEDHAGASSSSSLNINKARQVATHDNWVRENLEIKKKTQIYCILVTPASKVARGGMCHLNNVLYWELSEFREWSELCLTTIRELRKTFYEPGNQEWRDRALQILREKKLTANKIVANLKCASDEMKEL